MKQIINGVEVDLTPDEITEFNQRAAHFEANVPERMTQEFKLALEAAIAAKALERSYSSAVSCVSYKDSTNAQWAAEAQAFILWRDICYEYAYDYLSQALEGQIPSPNIEEFLLGLPEMQWPENNN